MYRLSPGRLDRRPGLTSFRGRGIVEVRRIPADGVSLGTRTFAGHILRDSDARARVLQMRSKFTKNKKNVVAIGVIARKKAA